MHILVQTPNHKHLVVVVHRVRSKEFLWLFKRTVLALDLVRLRVEAEAVRDPALVPSKDQNFAVAQRKAADSVTWSPLGVFVDKVQLLEFLFVQIGIAIQPLESVKWGLSLTVSTRHNI